MEMTPPETIDVSTAGPISERERAYAVEKIGRVVDTIERRVLHVGVRLERAGDPARELPALARVALDIDGRRVRAHVAGHSVEEAVDLVAARLRQRLEDVAEHRRALGRRGPSGPPGQWRHGDLPTPRRPYHPRPVEDRQIVRRKTYSPAEESVDDAILGLEAMDYDFYLFRDSASGQDALVVRGPHGTYELTYRDGPGVDRESVPTVATVDVRASTAPELTLDQARTHLDLGDEPRVFFKDATSGCAGVLYRRFDGHYGLITPSDRD